MTACNVKGCTADARVAMERSGVVVTYCLKHYEQSLFIFRKIRRG